MTAGASIGSCFLLVCLKAAGIAAYDSSSAGGCGEAESMVVLWVDVVHHTDHRWD